MQVSDSAGIRILLDEPTIDDPWGTHDSIAGAIRTLIESNEGGISIALTGTYGSGKSSVLRMLSEKPPQNADIFIFDAWAHQRDPIRRSFLESLTAFFLNKQSSPINKTKWHDKLKELTGKTVKTNTKEFPYFNPIALFVLALTVLIPTGAALMNMMKDTSGFWTGVGFFLAIGAPAVILLAALVLFITKMRPLYGFHVKCRQFFSPISGHAKTETLSESHQTGDPTSIEFEAFFYALLNDAMGVNDQKMVIVIDNMDRVALDDALSIWATMRTFFACDNKAICDWRRRLWLIVAFDRTAIKRLWPNPIDDWKLARAFSDKTFQISFDVPPQVLENWSSYFEDQLKVVFQDHFSEKEIHMVYLVYRLKVYPDILTPTPRDIKIFINRLSALYLRWGKSIPLQLQALYIALEGADGAFPDGRLVNDPTNLIYPCTQDLVGADYERFLAAIYYNTEPDIAMHTLIAPYLSKAIETRDHQGLIKAAQLPGFTKVCESYVERNITTWGTLNVDMVGTCAGIFSQIAPIPDSSWDYLWDVLYAGFLRTVRWPSLDVILAKGIKAIMLKYPNQDTLAAIIRLLNASILFDGTKDIIVHPYFGETVKGLSILLMEIEKVFPQADLSEIHLRNSPTSKRKIEELIRDERELSIIEKCGKINYDIGGRPQI